jgi:alpha-N-arabinofuranosidase
MQGLTAKRISGQILTAGEITAHNTFEKPENVEPGAFNGAKATEGGFTATLPAKSIVVLEIEG